MSLLPLPTLGWRVFYTDGSTFASTDGAWEDAPRDGVAVVVYYHPDGRLTSQTEGRDNSRYKCLSADSPVELRGGWMGDDEFTALRDAARRSVL